MTRTFLSGARAKWALSPSAFDEERQQCVMFLEAKASQGWKAFCKVTGELGGERDPQRQHSRLAQA